MDALAVCFSITGAEGRCYGGRRRARQPRREWRRGRSRRWQRRWTGRERERGKGGDTMGNQIVRAGRTCRTNDWSLAVRSEGTGKGHRKGEQTATSSRVMFYLVLEYSKNANARPFPPTGWTVLPLWRTMATTRSIPLSTRASWKSTSPVSILSFLARCW